jgi:L-fuculose-phosphate aldolase
VTEAAARRAVVATARRMAASGLVRGTSGNVSVRVPGGFLVTPTALAPERMRPQDVVAMGLDGAARGAREPSTEWRIHRDLYRAREDVGAVVHTHSVHATALACLRRGIPAFHYLVAAAGGDSVRCAPYATYGTQALADGVAAALEGRRACLMANHGAVAVGPTLERAFALAFEVEGLARTYLAALAAGEPVLLSEGEMAEAASKYATYGAPSGPRAGARRGRRPGGGNGREP